MSAQATTTTTSATGSTSTAGLPGARPKRRLSGYTILGVLSVIGGIVIWWVLSLLNPVTLPGPASVAAKFGELAVDGILFPDIEASLSRVLIGFAIGSGLAIPLGFLMGWYRPVRAILEPWTQFFRMIPPLAIIPLAIVLMGIGEVPKIFVITLAAFLVSIVATFQGVFNVDRTLINAGRVLGARDFTIFRRIVVPASLPFIMVGLRQGLGASWATLVAAELIAAQVGIGYRMQQAQIYYDLPTIFVGLVAIGVLGLIMDRIILAADKKFTSWQERR